MYDPIVIGAEDGELRGKRVTAKTLWVEPGGGCSYATASIHLASIMLRHITGMELEEYVRRKLAGPMGFGRFGWGYKSMIPDHTAGGGGVAPRPTDMLRFAYLLLREGRWGDRQLLVGHPARRFLEGWLRRLLPLYRAITRPGRLQNGRPQQPIQPGEHTDATGARVHL